jgi:hypothetical protein
VRKNSRLEYEKKGKEFQERLRGNKRPQMGLVNVSL